MWFLFVMVLALLGWLVVAGLALLVLYAWKLLAVVALLLTVRWLYRRRATVSR